MTILGSVPPAIGLLGAVADAALKTTAAAIDKKIQKKKKVKTTADRDRALLDGAREKGLLSPSEIFRDELSKKLFSKLKSCACSISGKIADRACKNNQASKVFVRSLCNIMQKAGVDEHISAPLVEKLKSEDNHDKGQAAKAIKKLIQENVDSLSKVKLIVEEAAELNKKVQDKISGIDKINDTVERYEKHISQLVSDFRSRIGEAPKRLFSNDRINLHPEVKQVTKVNIRELKPEIIKTDESKKAAGNFVMINEAVESLQKVKELLVDIAEIQQEIEFLHSRVKPFEHPDYSTGQKLSQLEEEEEKKRSQLNFYMAEYSSKSFN